MAKNVSRRDFLKCAGIITAAVAAAGVLSGCESSMTTVKINYFYEKTNTIVKRSSISVPKGTAVIKASQLKDIPPDYVLADSNDMTIMPIDDELYILANVIKVSDKTTTVKLLYCLASDISEAGSVGKVTITVDVSATTVPKATIEKNLPSEYELVDAKDAYTIGGNGCIYITVKKKTSST